MGAVMQLLGMPSLLSLTVFNVSLGLLLLHIQYTMHQLINQCSNTCSHKRHYNEVLSQKALSECHVLRPAIKCVLLELLSPRQDGVQCLTFNAHSDKIHTHSKPSYHPVTQFKCRSFLQLLQDQPSTQKQMTVI